MIVLHKAHYLGVMLLLSLVIATGYADRLPNQTPENQIFSVDTVLEVTGTVDDTASLTWLVASPGSIPTGILGRYQSVADVTYKDSILTNGGRLSENHNFDFDSRNKASGLFNIENAKVLTYASSEGAHLVGEETLILSVAGNFSKADDTIRCVFGATSNSYVPAFCNIVQASSSLVNVNSAQVSTKGSIRAIAKNYDIPAELNYQIAVTPDANSGSGFAEGTVKTTYAGSIMEASSAHWDTWNKTSAENSWKDTTSVTGGIKNLQKAFGYKSGIMDPLPSNNGGNGVINVNGAQNIASSISAMGPPSDWTINVALDGVHIGSLWVEPGKERNNLQIPGVSQGVHTITTSSVDPQITIPVESQRFTVEVPEIGSTDATIRYTPPRGGPPT